MTHKLALTGTAKNEPKLPFQVCKHVVIFHNFPNKNYLPPYHLPGSAKRRGSTRRGLRWQSKGAWALIGENNTILNYGGNSQGTTLQLLLFWFQYASWKLTCHFKRSIRINGLVRPKLGMAWQVKNCWDSATCFHKKQSVKGSNNRKSGVYIYIYIKCTYHTNIIK